MLAHLAQYREQLEPEPPDWDRETQGKWLGRKPGNYAWYEIQDTVEYYLAFENAKIIYPQIAEKVRFVLDETGFYPLKTLYIIAHRDFYLLAILNSQVLETYMKTALSQLRGGYLEFYTAKLESLPIPVTQSSERNSIAALAQKAQELHMQRRARVEAFLQALGMEPAASNSRNPLERPWALSEAEFLHRARRLPNPDPALYRAAHEETAELTERIAALEREIDKRVAGLYGVDELPTISAKD